GGRAFVDGLDLRTETDRIRRRIGLVFQESTADDQLTGRENLELAAAIYDVPPAEARTRMARLLEEMSLTQVQDRLVKTYSGGMRRRLELAAGVIHTPKVLFLDEPTLGLDPQGRAGIGQVVRKMRDDFGVTVFLTTHYLDEAEELADRVAIMNHGRIVAMGTTEEIESRFGSGRRMVVKGGEDLLKYLRENTRLRVEGDGDEVVIFLRDKADAMAALGAIEESGADWGDLTVKGDSLEDVFLKLVGESGTIEKGAE
ncbi:MAG: ATP-binding cassette domain-containing protein, partial [Nitrososphaerota archaeon]|nr:ATP-binding cassette domain-containing protein [Nitrososphaerota archaeon]